MELGLHCGRLDFYGRGCWHRHLYDRKMVAALVYADTRAFRMTENNGGLTMKRKEAIEVLRRLPIGLSFEQKSDLTEALNIALAALRGSTREQVERMRGEWIVKHDWYKKITITECSKCEDETIYEFFFEGEGPNFCPRCGAPMTDEAVEILLKRLETLKDGTTD